MSPATATPQAGQQVDVAALATLAARLADASANLDARIAEAADRIAGPRIAAVEADAAARLAEQQRGYESELTRTAGLVKELRHQLDGQLRQVTKLRWVARYLPAGLRLLVLADPVRPGGWHGDRPAAEFVAFVDEAAAAAGVVAYHERPELAGDRTTG